VVSKARNREPVLDISVGTSRAGYDLMPLFNTHKANYSSLFIAVWFDPRIVSLPSTINNSSSCPYGTS